MRRGVEPESPGRDSPGPGHCRVGQQHHGQVDFVFGSKPMSTRFPGVEDWFRSRPGARTVLGPSTAEGKPGSSRPAPSAAVDQGPGNTNGMRARGWPLLIAPFPRLSTPVYLPTGKSHQNAFSAPAHPRLVLELQMVQPFVQEEGYRRGEFKDWPSDVGEATACSASPIRRSPSWLVSSRPGRDVLQLDTFSAAAVAHGGLRATIIRPRPRNSWSP